MPASCSVIDCEQKYAHVDDVSYHKFPLNNSKTLTEWIKFTGRGQQWKPTKWSAICSRHFSSQDYKTFGIQRRLNFTAIPTIRNPPNKIEQICDEDDENSVIEEEYPTDFIRHLVYTCRLCANNRDDTRLVDSKEYFNLIAKCLSFVNLETLSNASYSPTKICLSCVNQLCTFSAFIDRISRGQKDLESLWNVVTPSTSKEIPAPIAINIKQEPRESLATNIKEENMDPKPKETHYARPDLRKVYLKKPSIIQENKKFILINNNIDMKYKTPTKSNKESKNCEILEIINLYPPILDITSTTIKELQPYSSTIPIPTIQPIANMKIENTQEEEDVSDDYVYENQPPYEEVNLIDLIEYEHKYSMRPDFEQLPVAEEIVNLNDESFSIKKFEKQSSNNLRRLAKNVYKCGYCVKKFNTLISCLAHKRLCMKRKRRLTTRFKEDVVEKTANSKSSQPRIRIPRDYYCEKCETKYKADGAIRKHLKHHKSAEHWNKECQFCGKKFDRDYFLVKHITQKHDSNYNKLSLKPSVFQCSQCSKIFKSPFNLKIHMIVHSDTKDYVCEFCGKRFSGRTTLNQHRKNHDDSVKFICDYENCGRFFKRRFGLQMHMKSVHLKIRNFVCEICKRPFALKNDMKRCKHSLLNN